MHAIDLPDALKEDLFKIARQALAQATSHKERAQIVKKALDKAHGPGKWHVIVGIVRLSRNRISLSLLSHIEKKLIYPYDDEAELWILRDTSDGRVLLLHVGRGVVFGVQGLNRFYVYVYKEININNTT